jgi:hypothetical protein
MSPNATLTDEPSGMKLTVYRGPAVPGGSMRTRYKLTKPDGSEIDLGLTEWLGVIHLAGRWQVDS